MNGSVLLTTSLGLASIYDRSIWCAAPEVGCLFPRQSWGSGPSGD